MVIDAVAFVVSEWQSSGTHERLGQFYVNRYCTSFDLPWPSLFYERDVNKAKETIAYHIHGTKAIL